MTRWFLIAARGPAEVGFRFIGASGVLTRSLPDACRWQEERVDACLCRIAEANPGVEFRKVAVLRETH